MLVVLRWIQAVVRGRQIAANQKSARPFVSLDRLKRNIQRICDDCDVYEVFPYRDVSFVRSGTAHEKARRQNRALKAKSHVSVCSEVRTMLSD